MMNLHRADVIPEWDKIAADQRNIAQQIAAETNGVITPGNAVSLMGAALVSAGLVDIVKGEMAPGITKLGLGRMADLFDGTAADKTGTKSPLGEALDVIIDKSEMAAALPILIKKGIIPAKFGAAVVAQYGTNFGLTAYAKKQGKEMHTNRSGKLSTGLQWGAIGNYCIAAAVESHDPEVAAKIRQTANTLAVGSVTLGAVSVASYARDAFRK